MDLKLLLRYQVSGSVYIGWVMLFYYGCHSPDFMVFAHNIFKMDLLKEFAFGIPIGAVIHQFSVSIKNQLLGRFYQLTYFSDLPINDFKLIDNVHEKYDKKYSESMSQLLRDKLSNLNTFFYLRFDVGFLAPLLALLKDICIYSLVVDKKPMFLTLIIPILIVLFCGYALIQILVLSIEEWVVNAENDEKTNKNGECLFCIISQSMIVYLFMFSCLDLILILNKTNFHLILVYLSVIFALVSSLLLSYIPRIYKDIHQLINYLLSKEKILNVEVNSNE